MVSFTKTSSSISNPTATDGILAPYREGYTFGGWATTEGSTTAAYTTEDVGSAEDDVTLYAIWIEE
ncbi:MAG: InlB B-repeat-containing protein [Clostridiales bacterium]|nr:InlB B-repeat-containing protein [Clostridiales bacterium]